MGVRTPRACFVVLVGGASQAWSVERENTGSRGVGKSLARVVKIAGEEPRTPRGQGRAETALFSALCTLCMCLHLAADSSSLTSYSSSCEHKFLVGARGCDFLFYLFFYFIVIVVVAVVCEVLVPSWRYCYFVVVITNGSKD